MDTPETGDAKKSKSARKKPKPKITKKIAPIIIKFTATVSMIKINTRNTTVGLALPATMSRQVSRLMETKMPDTYLDVTAVVKKKQVKDGKAKDGKRRNRRRERVSPYKRRDQ